MRLTTSVNQSQADSTRYLCVVVEITDLAGNTQYQEVTPASATQRWSIRWVNNEEVLLDSADVGQYRIRRQPDGAWKGDFAASEVAQLNVPE